jgi:hypothetical protein
VKFAHGLLSAFSPAGRVAAVPFRLTDVVLFFEVLLGLASLLITWFGLYVVYRLVTDES